MRKRALPSVGLLVLAGAVFFAVSPSSRAAEPSIGHLQHLGYYNPYPYQPRYLFYPLHGGGYPWYDYRPYYGWHFPSDRAERQKEETPKAKDTHAHIIIRVPADAELWFNGTKVTGEEGTVRKFTSPPLTPGQRYSYEVRAQWQKNGQTITTTREVSVKAGTRINVDFTRRNEMEK